MANVATKHNKGEEFFFPGGTEYLPQTVIAESSQQAEEIWHKTKVPVGGIIKGQ